MILRRLSEHLKAQNWTAVALDFAIVVTGVFIGIQVSNWNDVRREHALERQYLDRLSSDIRLSARRAEDNMASHMRQVEWQSVMLEALESCTLDDETRSDFARGVIRIGQSTGRIGVISNLELRRALTEMREEHTRRTEVLGFIIQRASPQIAYVDSRAVIDIPTDGRFSMSDLSPDVVSFDFAALCQDPVYASAVSTIRFTTAVTLNHHRQMLERYEALLRMVSRE
jgi:hypothetical protein